MGEANRTPGKDTRQTGKGQHPCEGGTLDGGVDGEVTKQTKKRTKGDTGHRAAAAIDVGENLRCLALLRKRGQRTRSAVDRRVTDREHGNHDDRVHDGREHVDPSVLNGNDERRGGSVGRARLEKVRLSVWDEKPDQGQGDNVEEGDSPEHLFDGSWERLAGISGFGSGQTDQLGTTERKRGRDEDAAQSFEAMVERAGVVPVPSTNVVTVRTSSYV